MKKILATLLTAVMAASLLALIGLAITRNIIIMHRGAIKVQSVEGEGTTFQVRIPLVYVSN